MHLDKGLCTAGTMQSSNAFASLQLEGGSTIKAKLVVGSDGGNSKVRQMAQLRTVSWSYKQRGLVATVATATPNTSALQVFLPNGPLALLPVRDGFSNIVWSTTPAQAAELEAMTPTDFVNAVNMVGTADVFCAAASCTPLLVIHVVVSRTYLRTKLPVYISHSSCLAAGCLV